MKPKIEPITPPESNPIRYHVTIVLVPDTSGPAPNQQFYVWFPVNQLERRNAKYYDIGYAFEIHNAEDGILIVPKTQIRFFQAKQETYDAPVVTTGVLTQDGAGNVIPFNRNWTGHVVEPGSAAVTNAVSTLSLEPSNVVRTDKPIFLSGTSIGQGSIGQGHGDAHCDAGTSPQTTRAIS